MKEVKLRSYVMPSGELEDIIGRNQENASIRHRGGEDDIWHVYHVRHLGLGTYLVVVGDSPCKAGYDSDDMRSMSWRIGND